MPRTSRAIVVGMVYHVPNRDNGRMRLFHKDGDFAAFERVLAGAMDRYPVELLTCCLMSNYWHMVVRPRTDDGLGRLMRWLDVTHVRRHHEHSHTRGGGYLYQGRKMRFPIYAGPRRIPRTSTAKAGDAAARRTPTGHVGRTPQCSADRPQPRNPRCSAYVNRSD